MTALPKRYFTPAEYQELEDKADSRSQYVGGEIFAMAGAEPMHVEITDNLTAALRARFRDRPCRSYSTDLRVRVRPGDLWTYPAVAALCGEPRFDRSPGPASLLNPQGIFEVLSPSTGGISLPAITMSMTRRLTTATRPTRRRSPRLPRAWRGS